MTVTAAPDGTASPPPSRGGIEKAGREGRVLARVELRRAVQQAAVAATDIDKFVTYLHVPCHLSWTRLWSLTWADQIEWQPTW